MNTNEYLKPTGLDSPVTAVSVLLIGRDGKSPTKAIGSGVFVSTGLIMTARHVVEGFWDYYGDPKVDRLARGETSNWKIVLIEQATGVYGTAV